MEAGRGSEIKQETRLWDEQKMETKSTEQGGGGGLQVLQEPDLPFLALRPGFADQVKEMPKLPREARDDLLGLGLSVADASILSDDLGLLSTTQSASPAGRSQSRPATGWWATSRRC